MGFEESSGGKKTACVLEGFVAETTYICSSNLEKCAWMSGDPMVISLRDEKANAPLSTYNIQNSLKRVPLEKIFLWVA